MRCCECPCFVNYDESNYHSCAIGREDECGDDDEGCGLAEKEAEQILEACERAWCKEIEAVHWH